ncbi:hypothetical protein [Xiamenia xianingshaonis]|uniref:hypothetical protein n=1 Tax=Xiamenia xianingshaonis TaxID=2682776 RepID=UPI00140BA84D|nr:hypothetical protein [Xiamenia xianingshaonis]
MEVCAVVVAAGKIMFTAWGNCTIHRSDHAVARYGKLIKCSACIALRDVSLFRARKADREVNVAVDADCYDLL